MDSDLVKSLSAIYEHSKDVEVKVQEVWNQTGGIAYECGKLSAFAWVQLTLLALILWRVW